MTVTLRRVLPEDLPVFFAHQCDVDAAAMAGFTPRERGAFDAHWERILGGLAFVARTVEVEGAVAGYVSAFPTEGRVEIAYWLGRDYWHRGIGQAAVAMFLAEQRERPLFASVIDTNGASQAILERSGFVVVGEEIGEDGVCERRLRLG
ncbi:GNAT family N-acetyltransferase [Sphingomonas hankookensis]|uniref:GNAT family N-acetyltransferase n=1 Tax=Sphingomonas hankookensis TaxID=563996 RepID=UPI001F5ACCF0|nr:GNAT family N-acetyltransferase [Sphingomonas hankookensis]